MKNKMKYFIPLLTIIFSILFFSSCANSNNNPYDFKVLHSEIHRNDYDYVILHYVEFKSPFFSTNKYDFNIKLHDLDDNEIDAYRNYSTILYIDFKREESDSDLIFIAKGDFIRFRISLYKSSTSLSDFKIYLVNKDGDSILII